MCQDRVEISILLAVRWTFNMTIRDTAHASPICPLALTLIERAASPSEYRTIRNMGLFQNAQDCVFDRIYSICPFHHAIWCSTDTGCDLVVVVLLMNLPLTTVRNCRAATIAKISSRPRFSALCCYSTPGLPVICMLPSSTYKS